MTFLVKNSRDTLYPHPADGFLSWTCFRYFSVSPNFHVFDLFNLKINTLVEGLLGPRSSGVTLPPKIL